MKKDVVLKNRLKEARSEKKMTQEELAKKCGVARNTITSIERYEYMPSARLAALICNALDKKFEDLFHLEIEQTD